MQKRVVLSIRKTFHYSNNNKNGDETIKLLLLFLTCSSNCVGLIDIAQTKGLYIFPLFFDCMHGQTSNKITCS